MEYIRKVDVLKHPKGRYLRISIPKDLESIFSGPLVIIEPVADGIHVKPATVQQIPV